MACIEDVLDLYELSYNPDLPVVCMDEKSYQLLGEARESWAMRPGDNQKVDSEYIRNETSRIFAFAEALAGRHHISVYEHRTVIDWANEIKYLVDRLYPNAQKLILIMDNLNTHTPAFLYKTFMPQEERHIVKKPEIHYAPKQGSCLNIAEILNLM